MTLTTTDVQDMLDGMEAGAPENYCYSMSYPSRPDPKKNITVEWMNVGREDGIDRILNGEPQRFMFGCPEFGLELEVMVVPLDDEYSSTRMTGTDSKYCLVAVNHFGAYAFRLFQKHDLVAPYIREKLRLPEDFAIAMEYFLMDLMEGIHERPKG